jgi:DNA recombination protein RmuC
MSLLFLAVGLAIGAGAAWLVQMFRLKAPAVCTPEELASLKEAMATLQQQNAAWDSRFAEVSQFRAQLQEENRTLLAQSLVLQSQLATEAANRLHLEQRLAEEKAQIEKLNERMKVEFQNVAHEILQATSKRFTETNREHMGQVLQPLRENIEAFRKRVEETHVQEVDVRGRLFQELGNLRLLNSQLSEDASNLAKALRGESKTTGAWGEMILETVLAQSGLREGVEYERQASNQNEDGEGIQPDIVVRYPEQQGVLIIDAKASLKDYVDWCNTDDKEQRARSGRAHLASLRAHIRGLFEKKYQTGRDWVTPDFILLFVPIEGALTLALREDAALYQFAFERKIILITPSTLLATLKLVRALWQQDRQNKNAAEIAERGGRLYDKFVAFYELVEEIEKSFGKTAEALARAKSQLRDGRGSLTSQADKLRQLGAKISKQMPGSALALGEGESEPEPEASSL